VFSSYSFMISWCVFSSYSFMISWCVFSSYSFHLLCSVAIQHLKPTFLSSWEQHFMFCPRLLLAILWSFISCPFCFFHHCTFCSHNTEFPNPVLVVISICMFNHHCFKLNVVTATEWFWFDMIANNFYWIL